MAFGHDGNMLAAIESDASVYVWRVGKNSPTLIAALPVPPRPIDLAISSDSTLLAVVAETKELVIFDIADLDAIKQMSVTQVADSFAMSAAFHPQRPIVAIGSADRTVSMWNCSNPSNPKLISRLAETEGHQIAVSFNADGSRLAAAGTNATVSIWDLSDVYQPTPEYRLRAHGSGAYTVAFAPDAPVLLGAGPNQQIDRWLLDPDDAAQAFDKIGGDWITDLEWSRYVPANVPNTHPEQREATSTATPGHLPSTEPTP